MPISKVWQRIRRRPISTAACMMFVILFLSGRTADIARSAPRSQQPTRPLRVVTREIEPFVIQSGDRLTGFSVDLWDEIALEANLPFEWVVVDSVGEQLAAVRRGDADLAIAAVSMTSERDEEFDFSYPYLRAGPQIVTLDRAPGVFSKLFRVLFSPKLIAIYGFGLLVLLAVGHLVWLVERERNDHFPSSYLPGVWEGVWWAVVTVTTVGYGDRIVRGAPGRVLAMLWMFAGIFLLANFTAVVASELTVTEYEEPITGVHDLHGKRVSTVDGTTSAACLEDEGISYRAVEDIGAAVDLLESGGVDAIVYDRPVLEHYAARSEHQDLRLVGSPIRSESYAVVMPNGSQLAEPVNHTLLRLRENGAHEEIARKWSISDY